jgi:hypothetical protein
MTTEAEKIKALDLVKDLLKNHQIHICKDLTNSFSQPFPDVDLQYVLRRELDDADAARRVLQLISCFASQYKEPSTE